jgi:hypothetical protein
LVYQHSLTPLALPIKLNLPNEDLVLTVNNNNDNNINKNKNANTIILSNEQTKTTKQTASNSVQDARHLLEKGAGTILFNK